MECRDAQFYLRLKRHAADELGVDVTDALEGHLATCAACAADARAAASFDRALATAMHAVPVPTGLRERLITFTAAKQGAILRRKLYRGGIVAAAAVVLVCLGLGVFSSTRPQVDTRSIVEAADEKINNPDKYAQRWLKEQNLPDQLPWDFNYALLDECSYDKIAGRMVPYISFRSPDGGRAKVYMFRASEFDANSLQDAQASHFHAHVVLGQDKFRGVNYVIVHTGPPNQGLQPFLRPQSGLIV